MWAIRYLLLLALIVIVLGFAMYNSTQRVDINFPNRQYFDIPLVVVILWAFVMGCLVSFVLTIAYAVKVSAQLREGRKRVYHLEMELAALRNRSLEDIDRLDESEVRK